MQYCKDIGTEFFWSKLNLLSVACAKCNNTIRFYDKTVTDTVMMQAYFGRVLAPADFKNRRQIILHDYYSHYQQYVDGCQRVICIGQYDFPKFSIPTISFPSYPIDIDRYYMTPTNVYDVVIGGEIDGEADEEFILKSLPDTELKSIAVICSPMRDMNSKLNIAHVIDKLKEMHPGVKCYINSHTNNVMLDYLYRTAKYLIHVGDAKGGYLHSLAEFARQHGATVRLKIDNPSIELVDIRKFAKMCGIMN